MADKYLNILIRRLLSKRKRNTKNSKTVFAPKGGKKKDGKLTQLKKLDKAVKVPAKVVASIMGIIGFCCFGFGMAMSLEWQNTFVGRSAGNIRVCPYGPCISRL